MYVRPIWNQIGALNCVLSIITERITERMNPVAVAVVTVLALSLIHIICNRDNCGVGEKLCFDIASVRGAGLRDTEVREKRKRRGDSVITDPTELSCSLQLPIVVTISATQ